MSSRIKLRRVWLATALAALVGIVIWVFFLRSSVSYETQTIARSDIEINVTALGSIQPRNYVDVGAQASGAIRNIHVQPGEVVKKGQLLIEIDPSVQQSKVDADKASLASLHAQLAEQQAQRNFYRLQVGRQKKMSSEGSTREQDLQSAQNDLDVADARVDNLHALIEGALSTLKGDQAQLGYTRIFAPMAGTVVSLDAREGQTINATYQTPTMLRIADLSRMTVWTEVSEADVQRIKPAMATYFTTLSGQSESGPRRWNGRVRQILPAPPTPASQAGSGTAQPQAAGGAGKVVLYTVLVDVDNDDGALLPQMSAQVFFVIAARKNVLIAPLAALQPGPQAEVYLARVMQGDAPVDREVRVGVRDRLNAEVLSGLAAGEQIVTAARVEAKGSRRLRW